MTLIKDHPNLKGFAAHGAIFANIVNNEAIGPCPFCVGSDKHPNPFSVNVDTRKWQCFRCGLAGSFGKFLELVAAANSKAISGAPMLALSKDRGIKSATLRRWGVGYSIRSGCYTIPVSGSHALTDLRIYKIGQKTRTTPGASVGLVGYQDLDKYRDWPIYICEGEWDGMALDEILRICGEPGVAQCVTGASIFKREWLPGFSGRDVILIYDHDDAGVRGEAKAWSLLQGVARSVRCMHWPEGLPQAFDLRDLYINTGDAGATLQALVSGFHTSIRSRAGFSLEQGVTGGQACDSTPLPAKPGKGLARNTIIKRYRKWMHMPNPEPLDVIYGTLLANRLPGDPLWLFLVAPPGGSKSEFLMSLGDAPKVLTTTSLTPHALVSGAVTAGGGDPSLIPKLDGKVLVIKDFTSILSMNSTARDEILGVLRDAYDGETTKYFGTGLVKRYKSTFGIIAGVTPAIEMFTGVHSSLGERFIRYRIKMPGRISIGGDIIARAIDNIAKEGSMRSELRAIAAEALNIEVDVNKLPKLRPPMRKQLIGLAQWVAGTRAVVVRERYTREMLFKPVAEIGTRLAKQLGKLAIGIGLFHRDKELGEAHYRILVKVARDTVPDRVEDIIGKLWLNGGIDNFIPTSKVVDLTRLNPETCRTLLQDLTTLHVLQREDSSGMGGKWRLAPSMVRVMRPLEIYKEEDAWRKQAKK